MCLFSYSREPLSFSPSWLYKVRSPKSRTRSTTPGISLILSVFGSGGLGYKTTSSLAVICLFRTVVLSSPNLFSLVPNHPPTPQWQNTSTGWLLRSLWTSFTPDRTRELGRLPRNVVRYDGWPWVRGRRDGTRSGLYYQLSVLIENFLKKYKDRKGHRSVPSLFVVLCRSVL